MGDQGKTTLREGLREAVRNDAVSAISRLLEDQEGNINPLNVVDDNFSNLLLADAIDRGKHEVAQILIQRGFDPCGQHQGAFHLHRAITRGRDDVIKTVIQAGADVTVKNEVTGKTALHFAAASNNITSGDEIFDLLINANRNSVKFRNNDEQSNIKNTTCYCQNSDAISCTNDTFINNELKSIQDYIDRNTFSNRESNVSLNYGKNTTNEDMSIIIDVEEKNVSTNNKNNNTINDSRSTSIHTKGNNTNKNSSSHRNNTSKDHIKHGRHDHQQTSLVYFLEARDKVQGNTALHVACAYNHASAALCLLRNGANPNPLNEHGETPLAKLLQPVTRKGDDSHNHARLALARRLVALGLVIADGHQSQRKQVNNSNDVGSGKKERKNHGSRQCEIYEREGGIRGGKGSGMREDKDSSRPTRSKGIERGDNGKVRGDHTLTDGGARTSCNKNVLKSCSAHTESCTKVNGDKNILKSCDVSSHIDSSEVGSSFVGGNESVKDSKPQDGDLNLLRVQQDAESQLQSLAAVFEADKSSPSPSHQSPHREEAADSLSKESQPKAQFHTQFRAQAKFSGTLTLSQPQTNLVSGPTINSHQTKAASNPPMVSVWSKLYQRCNIMKNYSPNGVENSYLPSAQKEPSQATRTYCHIDEKSNLSAENVCESKQHRAKRPPSRVRRPRNYNLESHDPKLTQLVQGEKPVNILKESKSYKDVIIVPANHSSTLTEQGQMANYHFVRENLNDQFVRENLNDQFVRDNSNSCSSVRNALSLQNSLVKDETPSSQVASCTNFSKTNTSPSKYDRSSAQNSRPEQNKGLLDHDIQKEQCLKSIRLKYQALVSSIPNQSSLKQSRQDVAKPNPSLLNKSNWKNKPNTTHHPKFSLQEKYGTISSSNYYGSASSVSNTIETLPEERTKTPTVVQRIPLKEITDAASNTPRGCSANNISNSGEADAGLNHNTFRFPSREERIRIRYKRLLGDLSASLTLQDLCRLVILKSLVGQSLAESVHKLGLPTLMKTFLLRNDNLCALEPPL